ncbi:SRPBCC family protein [Bradyrhizobium diversitatis]|uniref:SRPBCC family protein n=1 Tax=Bradyrhizobium diversitatis TaxID=2755406 RepID=A0ABS0NV66_9BRAD|nr:SRPBCC family protein [Bradyrhizobium diversitatis]MBH5384891.1 SRPBCC family protein [Bradyrhizobium diversitatis]
MVKRLYAMVRPSAFLICAVVSLVLSGCGTPLVGADPVPSTSNLDHAREAARPELERSADFEMISVETEIQAPLASVTTWFADRGAAAFGSFLTGTDSVPGVVSTESLSGAWSKPGDRRRVVFSDNNTALEEITDRKPQLLQYQIWNLTNRTGRYIRYAVSELEFIGNGQATRVRWTYSFRPKIWPDGYLIRPYVQNDFRKFMEVGLQAMRDKAVTDLAPKRSARSS